jgi:hypothetical protein
MTRQRDEARRVVLHLRSLVSGQNHHLEHLVQSLTKPEDLVQEIENYINEEENAEADDGGSATEQTASSPSSSSSSQISRLTEAAGTLHPGSSATARKQNRLSAASFADVADRHLRDKTDAIAHIIRNIAEQCQAAVEGLQLAQDAENPIASLSRNRRRPSALSARTSDDGMDNHSLAASDVGEDSLLHRSGRVSSIPPTPDLIPNRSSTALSFISTTTATPERSSQQYTMREDIPTKIVEDDEEFDEVRRIAPQDAGLVTKRPSHQTLMHRPSGARISALGGPR